MAIFSHNGFLPRRFITKIISVGVSQLILIMCLLFPYQAYANTASSTLTTSYLGRLQNGYYNFQFKLNNTASNINKTVTKAVSPQSLSKVLRYVVSKRLAAFTALASVAATTGIEYQDTEVIYTPIGGTLADRNIGIDTYSNGFIAVGNINQACAIGLTQLAYEWRHLGKFDSFQNCELIGTYNNVLQMDICELTIPDSCWNRSLSLVLNPSTTVTRSIPEAMALDIALAQNPAESRRLVDPAIVPSEILPTEVTQAIAQLNEGLTDDQVYAPPYVPTAPNSGTATGAYGDGLLNLDFPEFCSWAQPLCDLKEWFTDDSAIPEPEEYNVSEFDKNRLPTNPQFNFNGQCPAPKTIALDLGLASTQIALPYDYLCSFAIDIRAFVILGAWLHACFIFAGYVRS